MSEERKQHKDSKPQKDVHDAQRPADADEAPPALDPDEKVEIASVDSMDASDPPSFTPTRAGASRHDDE